MKVDRPAIWAGVIVGAYSLVDIRKRPLPSLTAATLRAATVIAVVHAVRERRTARR